MADIFLRPGALNPNDIILNPVVTYQLSAATGAFVETGADADLLYNATQATYRLSAGVGAFVVTGHDATIVDQAPLAGGDSSYVYTVSGHQYVKPPRISFTLRYKASGGAVVGGIARVTYQRHLVPKTIPRIVPKVVPKVVPRVPSYLTTRAVGGISTSGRAVVHAHTHHVLEVHAQPNVEIVSRANVAVHLHHVHALVGSVGVEIAGLASVDFITRRVLDVNSAGGVVIAGAASVDVQPHLELYVTTSRHVEARGSASIVIAQRTPNVLTVVGRCHVMAAGSAQAVGIDDRLTDEELLFLLEAA